MPVNITSFHSFYTTKKRRRKTKNKYQGFENIFPFSCFSNNLKIVTTLILKEVPRGYERKHRFIFRPKR